MKRQHIAQLIATAAAIDHRVPPLDPTGNDDRIDIWTRILNDMDYQTCDQALLDIARNPQMIQIRPGDIYQAAKQIMRRNLDRVEVAAIEPPDNATGEHYLAWKRALIRAIGRGLPPAEAQAEADTAVNATRTYPSLAQEAQKALTRPANGPQAR